MKTLRHALEYLFFQSASVLFGLLSERTARNAGRRLGMLVYKRLGFRRKVTEENLRLAFPDLLQEDRNRIAGGAFQNVGVSLIELLRFPRLNRESARALVRIERSELLHESLKRGNGVILLTAHIGNWELIPVTLKLQMNLAVHSLYKPQSNLWIDQRIRARRTMFGTMVIPMGMGIREILRILEEGGCVLVAADQSAPRESIRMPFFGRDVPVFQGPAVFCLKTGASLLTAFCIRMPDNSYVLKFSEIKTTDLSYSDEAVRELTRRHLDETERVIWRYPDQWMWMHRRWKHSEDGG